jgi:hypothetical protein
MYQYLLPVKQGLNVEQSTPKFENTISINVHFYNGDIKTPLIYKPRRESQYAKQKDQHMPCRAECQGRIHPVTVIVYSQIQIVKIKQKMF